MTITFILVGIAVLALAFFLFMLRRRAAHVIDMADHEGRMRDVDLVAFRNLIDIREEEYLREHLPASEFRAIQRERLRAALDYVRCVSANAAVLIRLGEGARRSEDVQVAEAGQELVNNALKLRVYALFAAAKLYLGIILPGLNVSSARISDSYEDLSGLVGRLGRLRNARGQHKITATL